MFPQVDTKVPGAVEEEVDRIYRKLFPGGERGFVAQAFDWAESCFTGKFHDYQPIDARYHDLEHTLQGTLCLARLISGREAADARPKVSERKFQLTLLAILFHDTGYLKKKEDKEGTGAKYTPIHVGRSATFAQEFLATKEYAKTEISAVQNMISCTGVNADLKSIPFSDDLERTLGFALGTGDLLGQMAASDYVDKLPVLYLEFAESARFNPDKPLRFMCNSAAELMRNTLPFWEDYVLPKINNDFGKLYRFLNQPYPDGPNPYLVRIEHNMDLIRERLGRAAS